jgi:hypothetical protein
MTPDQSARLATLESAILATGPAAERNITWTLIGIASAGLRWGNRQERERAEWLLAKMEGAATSSAVAKFSARCK